MPIRYFRDLLSLDRSWSKSMHKFVSKETALSCLGHCLDPLVISPARTWAFKQQIKPAISDPEMPSMRPRLAPCLPDVARPAVKVTRFARLVMFFCLRRSGFSVHLRL